MAFDEPWQERRPGEIHDESRRLDGRRWADAVDAPIADTHDPAVAHLLAVEDTIRAKDGDGLSRRRLARGRSGTGSDYEDQERHPHGPRMLSHQRRSTDKAPPPRAAM